MVMKTLHTTKDIRDKFCAVAQKITEHKHQLQKSKNGSRLSSEGWLQSIFEEIRGGFYDESSMSSRVSIRPTPDVDSMLRQQITFAANVPSNLIAFNKAYWYPPQGFHEWTCDHENPGWHVQFIYASQPERSYLRVYDDSEGLGTYYDSGFDFRMFYVPPRGQGRFWQAVHSEVDRIVVDYRILNRGPDSF